MMQEILFFALCFIVLALTTVIRVMKGPNVADRIVAADCIDYLTDAALILFAIYSGRSVFLDIALITAILGFLGTVLTARYLEGNL